MAGVFFTLENSFINNIDKGVFSKLEEYIISSGEGADKDSFDVIRDRLKCPPVLGADEFAEEVIYVILASGFRQKVAKAKFAEIMAFIHSHNGDDVVVDNLMPIFGNVHKVRAICRVWGERVKFRDGFYAIDVKDIDGRLAYLQTLPFIGKITCNHIARNLGMNKVKYDVWIQRLGIALCGGDMGLSVSSPVCAEVRAACDAMFVAVNKVTGLPIGYIDVVLWKACQIGLFSFA